MHVDLHWLDVQSQSEWNTNSCRSFITASTTKLLSTWRTAAFPSLMWPVDVFVPPNVNTWLCSDTISAVSTYRVWSSGVRCCWPGCLKLTKWRSARSGTSHWQFQTCTQWRIQELLVGGVLSRASMEGPKVPSEVRRREAPRGWGLGRGAVAPPQHGGLGAMPLENFSKINVKIAYFSAFLQAEMVSSFTCSLLNFLFIPPLPKKLTVAHLSPPVARDRCPWTVQNLVFLQLHCCHHGKQHTASAVCCCFPWLHI